MPKIKTYRKPRPFVGLLRRRQSPSMPREGFYSSTTATEETHGHRYHEIYGPFRTLRGSRWCVAFGPTEIASTVSQMEAVARAAEEM